LLFNFKTKGLLTVKGLCSMLKSHYYDNLVEAGCDEAGDALPEVSMLQP